MYKITFLFILIGFSCLAQKTYHFDHILEYEFRNKRIPDSIPSKEYWLTNSKDNSYIIIAREISRDSVYIGFEERTLFHGGFKIKTSELFEETEFNIPCSFFHKFRVNPRYIQQNYFAEVKDSTKAHRK